MEEIKHNFNRQQTFMRKTGKDTIYVGDATEDEIRGLTNPFESNTAAFEAFELFRTGGTKVELADALNTVCLRRNIQIVSPELRLQRVITEIRRMGYELKKAKGTKIYRLTGRKC